MKDELDRERDYEAGRVDIRRDDSEPVYDHQVHRDELTNRRTYLCTDPNCDIKMPGHSHYRRKE